MGSARRALDSAVVCLPSLAPCARLWLRMAQCLLSRLRPAKSDSLLPTVVPARKSHWYVLGGTSGSSVDWSREREGEESEEWRVHWKSQPSPHWRRTLSEWTARRSQLSAWRAAHRRRVALKSRLLESAAAVRAEDASEPTELQRYMESRQRTLRKQPAAGKATGKGGVRQTAEPPDLSRQERLRAAVESKVGWIEEEVARRGEECAPRSESGDLQLCVDWLTTSIALFRRPRSPIRDDAGLICAHLSLAYVQLCLDNWEQAYAHAKWALDLAKFEAVPLTGGCTDGCEERPPDWFAAERQLARVYLAEACLNLAWFPQAKAYLDPRSKSTGDHCLLCVNMACCYVCESGSLQKAFLWTWAAIESDPGYAPALRMLVYIHLRNGDAALARDVFERREAVPVARWHNNK